MMRLPLYRSRWLRVILTFYPMTQLRLRNEGDAEKLWPRFGRSRHVSKLVNGIVPEIRPRGS